MKTAPEALPGRCSPPEAPRDGPGVHVGNATHIFFLEIFVQRHGAAVVGDNRRQVAHNDALQVALGGLAVVCRHPSDTESDLVEERVILGLEKRQPGHCTTC